MKKNGLLLLYCYLILGCSCIVYGQSDPDIINTVASKVVPTSPDAAAIMLYQTYPIDYVSGAPQIKVPLFTAKTNIGDIPYYLDYQIGKVKPSVLSGIVGTGWTLSPDLGITRSVHGAEDGINKGYPVNNQLGSVSNTYLYSAAKGLLDEQPDDYFYSLLLKGGSFIYKRNYGFVPLSYNPVTISHPDDNSFVITDDDGTKYLFGKYSTGSNVETEITNENNTGTDVTTAWRITEIISYNKADTIRFYYNTTYNTQIIPYFNAQWKVVEFSMAAQDIRNSKETEVYRPRVNFQEPANLVNQTGYEVLKPAIAHTGDFGLLNYFDLMLSETPPANDYKMTLSNDLYSQASINQKAMWSHIGNFGASYNDGSAVRLNYIKQILLDSVTYRGGKVVFSYASDRQLAALYAYAGGKIVKSVRFVQHQTDNYLPGVKPGFMTQDLYNQYCNRYFLDSVIIKGTDTISAELRYGLTYTSDELGVYSNYNTDYWDYWRYASYENNVPHIPYHLDNYIWYTGSPTGNPNDSTIGGRQYTPLWIDLGNYQEKTSPSAVLPQGIGLLSKITYPTGGSARFEFEENRYESFATAGEIVYGGGYRIKSIHYINGQEQDSLIKKYTYGTNGENGYGLTKNSQYDYNFMYLQWTNTVAYSNPADTIKKITYLNAKPFLDNSFSNGAAVLYPSVTEYSIAPSNNIPSGKTVYTYLINHNTLAPGITMTPICADARDSWRNIVPYSVALYRYDGGNYIPVQSKHFQYASYIKDSVPAAQTYLNWYNPDENEEINYGTPSGVEKFPHVSYSILCGAQKLMRETDTAFDQAISSRYVVTQTDYGYDADHLYQTSIKKTDSRGYTDISRYWYSFQSSVPGYGSSQLTLLTNLKNNNRIAIPIEQADTINNMAIQSGRQEFLANGSYPMPGSLFLSIRSGTAYKKVEIISYDGYGNIREQQGVDSVRETFLWGYNSLYPVAKIIGSSYTEALPLINQAILDNVNTSDNNMRNQLNSLRTGLPKAQVWTYTYNPGVGMTSSTDPNGNITYYNYDSLGRLMEIRDKDGNLLKTHSYHYINP